MDEPFAILPVSSLDPVLEKTIDITNTEDVGLAVWLEAVLKKQFDVAREILQTCLLAEHYRSFLPNSLADATPDQRATLATLNQKFKDALDKFKGERPAPVEGAKLGPENFDLR